MIRDGDLAEGEDRPAVGGKAAGLVLLHRQGLPVPPFFVVLPEEGLDSLEAALADLGPASPEEVRAAIATCRASGASERVRAYCAARGIEPGPVTVVVQHLIQGRASGVLFTRDPDMPEQCLISAAWGLGEGVVQGSADCDAFRIDTQGGFTAEIEAKWVQVRLVDGTPAEAPVPEAQRTAPMLSEAQARQFSTWGRTLERRRGACRGGAPGRPP